MEMHHGLTSVDAIVDDNPVAVRQALRASHLACDHHEMTQDGLVSLRGVRQANKPVSLLGNDEDVNWCLRIDIPECQGIVIFVHYCGRNIFRNYLVKYCGLAFVGLSCSPRLRSFPSSRCFIVCRHCSRFYSPCSCSNPR